MELYYGGTIYTMEAASHTVEAVLVHEGIIVEVYNEVPEIDATYIDLQGGVMFPGFVDTHIHLVGTGMMLSSVSFHDETDIKEVKRTIRQAAESLNKTDWLICEGFDDNKLGSKLYKEDLDELGDCNIIVKRICRHAAIVNSNAYATLNVTNDIEDMEGGKFERDADELNGWVHDRAMDFFVEYSLNETVDSLKRHMVRAASELNKVGITGVHTEDLGYYKNYKNVLTAYEEVFKTNRNLRINMLVNMTVIDDFMGAQFVDDEWVKVDGMKVFLDGAFGGRTAHLSVPYSDADTSGYALYSDDALGQAVIKAREYKTNIAAHMIGDASVDQLLNLIELYPPEEGFDRLIHASLLRDDQLERMENLAIVCDVQPTFLTSDFPWLKDRIGEARVREAYRFKSLISRGILTGGGSDAPIEHFNPLLAIQAAVLREVNGEVINQEEALTVYEAIELYTSNAAKTGRRDKCGYIARGRLADFTILEEDPFVVAAERISEIKVAKTIVNGQTVYTR